MARILVVDDDALLADTLREGLVRAGHEVSVAHDGVAAQALVFAATEPIGAIVTDVLMPECDGIELILALRRRGIDVPIVAISGGGSVVDSTCLPTAARVGAAATLGKPFALRELIDTLDSILASRAPVR